MDHIRKALSEDKNITVMAIDATQTVQESLGRLKAFPPSMVHLGQAMLAALLLQTLLGEKEKLKIALQWQVDGPFGPLFAEANHKGQVRGTLAYPQAPIDNYETLLGPGLLQVRKKLKEVSSQGVVEAKGQVVDDLLEYLEQSEQRSCTMALSVKIDWAKEKNDEQPFVVEYARGYLVDVLPQKTKEHTTALLYKWDQFLGQLGPISEWALETSEGESVTDSMLRLLFANQDHEKVFYQQVEFHCHCTQERAERAFQLSENAVGNEVVNIEESHEVRCEFCGRSYDMEQRLDS